MNAEKTVSHVKTIAAIVAGALGIAAVHCSAAAQEVSVNDTARFIAGLPPSESSPLARLTENPKWQAYAQSSNTNWQALESRQLVHVRGWSDKHLQTRKAPLYYMFSGPDFLYANAFFPEASTYLMSGLETVGPVPTVSERTIAALPRIQSAIGNSVKLSFFITSQMGGLQSGDLPGALPIILVYAVVPARPSRTSRSSASTMRASIQPPSNGRNATPGVKITVRTGDGPPQAIYYFRTDVSNTGVSSSGFLAFAGKLGQGQAFFKSASYLAHGSGFSMVRDLCSPMLSRLSRTIPAFRFPPSGRATRRYSPFRSSTGSQFLFSEATFSQDFRNCSVVAMRRLWIFGLVTAVARA